LWSFTPPPVDSGGFSTFRKIAVLPDNSAFAASDAFFPMLGLYQRALIYRIDASGNLVHSKLITPDPVPTDLFPFHLFEIPRGLATDASRNRVYAAVERFAFPLNFDVPIFAYDLSLNQVAYATFSPEDPFGEISLDGVFVDEAGFVWVAGFERQSSGDDKLFVSRFGPDLAGPQVTQRFLLAPAQRGDVRAAGDSRGGVVFSVTPFADTEQSFTIRANSAGFQSIRPYPAFVITSLTTDTDGAIYAGGISRTTSRHGVIKVDTANDSAWTPEMLSLEAIKTLSSAWSPVVGTLDLVGQAGGSTFLSRYAAGEAFNRIRAITPSGRFEPVGVPMLDKLVYEVLDNAEAPQSDVEVSYSITQTNPPAGRSSAVFYSSETKTDSDGLARAGLRLGFLPVEYTVSANCPTCRPTLQTAEIQVCGKIETRMFRNNVDSPFPGESPWTDSQLDHHYLFLITDGFTGNIRFKGCALTATTMLLNIYKHRYNLTYADSTPATLNNFWSINDSEHYGFSEGPPDSLRNLKRFFDGGLYFPRAIQRFTKGEVRYLESPEIRSDFTVDDAMALVDLSLDVGDPALLWIESSTDAGHYMTVVGRCGRKYFVLDPNINTNHTVVDLDNLTVTIKGVRLFEKG